MIFKKYCKGCGKSFRPTGRCQKLCDECRYKNLKNRKKKK